MKKCSVLLFFFVFSFSFSQSANNYKYALVPSKFSFLREADQYQLNSLTKFLMEKEGFVSYLDTDQMPEDVVFSNCNKVFVEVLSSGNFMSTKLKVVLKDCKGNILFTSEEGKSKEKDYKKGYQEALREAFKSFNKLHYVYTPNVAETNTTNEVAKSTAIVAIVAIVAPVAIAPIAVPTANTSSSTTEVLAIAEETLFAQPITNGFQLIDSSPKVIMKIYNTSIKNIYIAKVGDKHGVFISKDIQWYFEYYQNDKLISEKINVKF